MPRLFKKLDSHPTIVFDPKMGPSEYVPTDDIEATTLGALTVQYMLDNNYGLADTPYETDDIMPLHGLSVENIPDMNQRTKMIEAFILGASMVCMAKKLTPIVKDIDGEYVDIYLVDGLWFPLADDDESESDDE
jgi:hypothetical protein